jgi:hypothetical protein
MSAIDIIAPSDDLLGPDLNTVPSLEDQIARLDAVAATGDADDYALAWMRVSDQNGGCPVAFWDSDDADDKPAHLMTGVHFDSQEEERHRRWKALHEHQQGVDGFKPALERLLVRLGRYSDNRKTRPTELKAAVRALIATGGRLMLPPDGTRRAREPVEFSVDMKRWGRASWSEVDAVAGKAMSRLTYRWRAQVLLERIVRKLGDETPNGWFVLEARS